MSFKFSLHRGKSGLLHNKMTFQQSTIVFGELICLAMFLKCIVMSSAFTLQGIRRDYVKDSVKFKDENGPPVRVASWVQGNENGNFRQRVFSYFFFKGTYSNNQSSSKR